MELVCIMLLLELVHVLIKFAQAHNTFVCDFVVVMKMWCVELYMYSNCEKKYGAEQFKSFLDLHENINIWPIIDCLVDWFCNKHPICGFLLHGQAIPIT